MYGPEIVSLSFTSPPKKAAIWRFQCRSLMKLLQFAEVGKNMKIIFSFFWLVLAVFANASKLPNFCTCSAQDLGGG